MTIPPDMNMTDLTMMEKWLLPTTMAAIVADLESAMLDVAYDPVTQDTLDTRVVCPNLNRLCEDVRGMLVGSIGEETAASMIDTMIQEYH